MYRDTEQPPLRPSLLSFHPLHLFQKVTFNSLCATNKSLEALADTVSRQLAFCLGSGRFSGTQSALVSAVSRFSCTSEKLLPFPAQRHGKAHLTRLLSGEALTGRTNQLEVIRQIVSHCTTHIIRTFHKWLSLLWSCVAFLSWMAAGGWGGG